MNKDILVVLDVDGTITKPDFNIHGTWGRIDQAILDDIGIATTQFLRRHFLEVMRIRGMTPYDHQTWFELTLQAWKECGLTKDKLTQLFSENTPHLRPGFQEFLKWLKLPRDELKVYIVINTYGVSQAIEQILLSENVADLIDEVYAIPLRFTADGSLDGYNEQLLVTAELKGTLTMLAMKRWDISPQRTIGIGDSSGDRFLAPKHRLLVAKDQEHLDRCHKHFSDHVITENWSGVQAWLAHHFRL